MKFIDLVFLFTCQSVSTKVSPEICISLWLNFLNTYNNSTRKKVWHDKFSIAYVLFCSMTNCKFRMVQSHHRTLINAILILMFISMSFQIPLSTKISTKSTSVTTTLDPTKLENLNQPPVSSAKKSSMEFTTSSPNMVTFMVRIGHGLLNVKIKIIIECLKQKIILLSKI